MKMRAALAFLLAFSCVAAWAQTQADPVAYIRSIYARHEHDNPPAWQDQNYSVRLRKLIKADQKETQAGDAGKFDWDPIINAQDWKLSAIKVTPVSRDSEHAPRLPQSRSGSSYTLHARACRR